jgi:pimeloyl-ACP methyl ester carboxylesterase
MRTELVARYARANVMDGPLQRVRAGPRRMREGPIARDLHRWRALALLVWTVLAPCLAGGCSTPVGVERADAQSVHRQLTGNVLSTGELSDFTQNSLRSAGLSDLAEDDPQAALAAGHEFLVRGMAGPNMLFALSELAFKSAIEGGGQPYYLASAVYAFAYLFPKDEDAGPSPSDPRYRWATDLYNLAITRAFETEEGAQVMLRSSEYELPFGRIEVMFDQDSMIWGERRFTEFAPAAELQVRGLRNRYRRPGLGAPLAAATVPLDETVIGFQVAPNLRVPVTAVLLIEVEPRSLTEGRLEGRIELHPPGGPEEITIAGRTVPLEVEPTAALAYGLGDSPIWATEYQGFLFGDLLTQLLPRRLYALQPHQPGRSPVVLVHGTASSAARWADMVNDLTSDPAIRDRFEFWFFAYETGNPIPYSALELREALEDALTALNPACDDPALRDMVLIGHSQGGLLVKMTAVDTGSRMWDAVSRKPLDELRLEPATRELLRKALFLQPEPFVGRVIFLATPHRGSYLAEYRLGQFTAGLVRLPGNVARATTDIASDNSDAFLFDPRSTRFNSVYGMMPGSPGLTTLAETPISPDIPAHSIIAVRDVGPLENASDGVVRYESAHIDGVESEIVVRSGHSVQSHPEAVLEVRRILLEHAEEAAARAGTGCGGEPMLVSK